MSDNPESLNVRQVAALLGIQPKTLRKRLAKRNGTAPRPIKAANGYNLVFLRADVEQWIADHRDGANK